VGGQSLKMAKPFLGVELAMRCERSEHGESQQFIKNLCAIYTICFSIYSILKFLLSLSQVNEL